MRLDAAEVLDVAARARIRLGAADAARLATELGRVLAWADGLLPVRDASVPPFDTSSDPTPLGPRAGMSAPHPPPVGPLRADVPSPSPGPDLLAESAGRDGRFVRVPPVR